MAHWGRQSEVTMKTFDPDDPMLTAYVLGELEGEELRELEALLARDADAAAHVASIRSAASGFSEAFEQEAAPSVEPIRLVEIEPRRRGPLIPFLFYATTAAAACFFVVLVIRLGDPATPGDRDSRAADAPLLESDAKGDAVDSLGRERAKTVEPMEPAASFADSADARSQMAAPSMMKEEGAPKAADASGPGANRESRVFRPANERSDRDRQELAPPPPEKPNDDWPHKNVAPLGEVKMTAAGTRAPRESEMDSVRQNSATVSTASKLMATTDARALLADLGYKEANEVLGGADESLEGQLSHAVSHQPDPEAALLRAVEGFARLIDEKTPSSDEAWDRVLADARYAAGTGAKRLEFVARIENARKAAADGGR